MVDFLRVVDVVNISKHQHRKQHAWMKAAGATGFVLVKQWLKIQMVKYLANNTYRVMKSNYLFEVNR